MRLLLAAVVICSVGSMSTGCAMRAASRTAPDAELSAADALETHIEKVRHLSARPTKTTALPTIEQQDRHLASVLLQVALAPTGEHHRKVAERYRALGIADAAYEHFSRALARDRRDAAAHDGLARVWRDWGFPHLAIGDAHRALYYAPTSAAAHNTMGTIFQALGQHDAARQYYAEAASLDPGAAYALSNLCYLSFLQGDFDHAAATCRSALTVDPAYRAAHNNLALTYAASGRLDLARTEFMEAGDKALGFFNMGIVHMAGRNYELATAAFDAASRANPSMNKARERATEARNLGRTATRSASGDLK